MGDSKQFLPASFTRAINPSSKILAAPDTLWDRSKWLRGDDMLRASMLAALFSAPAGPAAMLIGGAAAGLDEARNQMWPDETRGQVTYAAAPDPKKALARLAARLARGKNVPAEPLPSPKEVTPSELLSKTGEVIPTAPAAVVRTGKRAAANQKKGAIFDIRPLKREEAVKAIKKGAHLKQDASGQYIGAPAGIDSPQKLAAWRASGLRRLKESTVIAPSGGTWYNRAAGAMQEMAGPDNPEKLDNTIEGTAVYSAQANPQTNLGFLTKAWNEYLTGSQGKIRTGQQDQNFYQGMQPGSLMKLGPKTGMFARRMKDMVDTIQDPANVGGSTNDIWHARFMGYREPSGKLWSKGLTKQQHAFLDAETLLLAEKANAIGLGGRSDWGLGSVQAAPWVSEKAMTDLKRHPKWTREQSIANAEKTYAEHLPQFTAYPTEAMVPSPSAEHLKGLIEAPLVEREAYTDAVNEMYSRNNRSTVLESLGMLQRPQNIGVGVARVPGGQVETNPVVVSRPMVGMLPENAGITDASRQLLDANAALTALTRVQNVGSWSKPIFNAKPRQMGSLEVTGGGDLTPELAARIADVGKQAGLPNLIDYGGTFTLNSPAAGKGPDGSDVLKLIKGSKTEPSIVEKLADVLASPLEARRVKVDRGAYSLAKQWPLEPGSGAATARTLKVLGQNPNIYAKLNNAPELAAAIGQHRDYDYANAGNYGPVREDVQNMRRIMAENPTRMLDALREALSRGDFLPLFGILGMGLAGAANRKKAE